MNTLQSNQNPFFEEREIWSVGEKGYTAFLVVGLYVSSLGTIFAYSDARHPQNDNIIPSDIVLKTSQDGGKTWSDLRVIVDGQGQYQYSNPIMIEDKSTKTLHLFYFRRGSTAQANDANYSEIFVQRSIDNGRTFSKPIEITNPLRTKDIALQQALTNNTAEPQFSNDDPNYYGRNFFVTGPANPIQLSASNPVAPNRMVMPIFALKDRTGQDFLSRGFGCMTLISDDGGANWQAGGIVPANNLACAEGAIIELDNGDLLMNSRVFLSQRRALSISKDGGITWTAQEIEQTNLPSFFETQASLHKFTSANQDPTNTSRTLISFPNSTSRRENLEVWLSYDNHQSWARKKQIYSGTAYYSDITQLADSSLLLIYTKNGTAKYTGEQTMVARFNLAWLTDCKDSIEAGIVQDSTPPIVIDNNQIAFQGDWGKSRREEGFEGSDYSYLPTQKSALANAVINPNIAQAGYYDIWYNLPKGINRTEKAQILLKTKQGSTQYNNVNQQERSTGDWHLLGTHWLEKGTSNELILTATTESDKFLIADAFTFEYSNRNQKDYRPRFYEETELWDIDKTDYKVFAVLGLYATKQGELFAYSDARKFGIEDGNPSDIVLRKSTDGGKTWGPLRVIVNSVEQYQYSNPVMIQDRVSNNIHLLYFRRGTDNDPKDPSYGEVYVQTSVDSGRLFTKPILLTETLRTADKQLQQKFQAGDAGQAFEGENPDFYGRDFFVTGPGTPIQLRSTHPTHPNRIIVPMFGIKNRFASTVEGKGFGCMALISDNGGTTWEAGGIIPTGGLYTVEPNVIELEDGRLLMNMRVVNNSTIRALSYSSDGGETWTKTVADTSGLPEFFACHAGLRRLSFAENNQPGRILFSFPDDINARRNLKLFLSYDDHQSWAVKKSVRTNDAFYSNIAILPDNTITMIYGMERLNNYAGKRTMFARFNLEWLSGGADYIGKAQNTSITFDNGKASYTGTWGTADNLDGFSGNNYAYSLIKKIDNPSASATYPLSVSNDGYYDLWFKLPLGKNRATFAQYTVLQNSEVTHLPIIDQDSYSDANWHYLGSFYLKANKNNQLRVATDIRDEGKYLVSDIIKLTKSGIKTDF